MLLIALGAAAEPNRMIRVYDGDTIFTRDGGIRVVGLNAPERGSRAQCKAERILADRAKARLQQIVDAGAVLRRVPCSCPPGTEGTFVCNYGRIVRGAVAQRARRSVVMIRA
jgi:endonuclease YncB( thermonuclease family)